ncbi:HD-GYP domain-containing protein [Halobacillus seohaensis]|uniref:HD-GYP domain-containing protein n=1 Tax=Halobacillus seohaensis TaxID=447421 RepID=A0ABW2EL47_9BACI
MEVHPSQLEPGCIIVKEIMGKTNQPIIPKNTVLHPLHISVLHKFMIESVEVGPKLSNGSPFLPQERTTSEPSESYPKKASPEKDIPFRDYYLEVVKNYQQWFERWQGGSPLDMHEIRKFMVPLIEKAVKSNREVFTLHHFSSDDHYQEHHSVAMGLISAFLASKLGYSRGEWIQAGLAGLLSDCGMARIDANTVNQKGSLSKKEYEEVKKHATYSYRLVENVSSLGNYAKLGILQHHERLDGSGYPLGLRQNKIHRFSQIIAVSDMYHAMTSERIYRRKQSPFKVIEEILQEQFGRYDHEVIQVFVKQMANYSTGTKVRLTTNQMAEIIFIEPGSPTKPMVRLQETEEIIHLKDQTNIHIEEIFDG